jgi:phosphoribosylglycinamide formyltransferase-1
VINIAVLVSGSGSNLQALIDSCKTGYIPGKIVLVVSSSPSAYALKRAEKENIKTCVIERGAYENDDRFTADILTQIKALDTDLICLAGFLKKLGPEIIREYGKRIMNIHPALLPAFGGEGMYGIRVHEAVLKSGEEYSGCSVHWVDEKYDHGPVIMQKKVSIGRDDTPETLAARILEEEHKLYPEAVRKFAIEYMQSRGEKI